MGNGFSPSPGRERPMSQHFICPRGHQWETADDGPTPAAHVQVACLVCGAESEVYVAPSSLAAWDTDADMPPPPKSIPAALAEAAAGLLAPPRPISEVGPPTVAGYEILDRLGRGGMGVVYRARHLKLNRLVALKMILAGTHAEPEDLARFRTETEAVARLRHPNIIQIHDVGDCAAGAYCALEFLEGGSLDQKLAGTPQPARWSAQLVETLARAVHHAHECGIIHRDLKPANVLLSADGLAKITDFGLAKRLDLEDGLTRTGEILGTPSYMAPEQTGGSPERKRRDAIGPLVDVYALGAILYELLTGRPPFKGASLMETLLQVRSEEPVPPRRLVSKVPRDLETICLKCLEKEARRRYGSALHLADDLRQFLDGRPIVARPVGPVGRAAKWARRRPLVAGLWLLATLALVGALTGSLVALQEQRKANAALQQKATYALLVLQGEEIINDVGRQIHETANLLARVPGLEKPRQRILEAGLKLYQELLDEGSTDPAVRLMTARASFQIGTLQEQLRQRLAAEESYRRAKALCEELLAEFPDKPLYLLNLARACDSLGLLLFNDRRPKEAKPLFDEALKLHQGLVDEYPDERGLHKYGLASSYYNQALYLRGSGQPREAEPAVRRAQQLWKELLEELSEERSRLHGLARAHGLLSLLVQADRAKEEVEKYRQEAVNESNRAVDLYRTLTEKYSEFPEHRLGLANELNNLAVLLRRGKQLPEAEETYRQALAAQEKLVEDFPTAPAFQNAAGSTLHNLALLLLDRQPATRDALAEARQCLEKAIRHQQAARKGDARNPLYRQHVSFHYRKLIDTLVLLDEHAEAARVAAEQMRIVTADTHLPEPERQKLVQEHSDQAMKLLREAIQKGYNDPQRLQKEFGPLLGSRDDFQQLLKQRED